MLIPGRLAAGIREGSITLAYRRWDRPRAVAGRVHRTAAGMVEILAVDSVSPASITAQDAQDAGWPSPEALLAGLPGDPAAPLFRIRFRPWTGADPRAALARSSALSDDDAALLRDRLARMDAASAGGPWTQQTLAIIARHPGRRAAELAERLGRERLPFKADVRKLKALGLTESLPVGYRLSPRGQAWLSRTAGEAGAAGGSGAAR